MSAREGRASDTLLLPLPVRYWLTMSFTQHIYGGKQLRIATRTPRSELGVHKTVFYKLLALLFGMVSTARNTNYRLFFFLFIFIVLCLLLPLSFPVLFYISFKRGTCTRLELKNTNLFSFLYFLFFHQRS